MAPWYWWAYLLAGCLAVLVAVSRTRGSTRSGGVQEDHLLGSFDGWALRRVAVMRGLHEALGQEISQKETLMRGLDKDGTNVAIIDW